MGAPSKKDFRQFATKVVARIWKLEAGPSSVLLNWRRWRIMSLKRSIEASFIDR